MARRRMALTVLMRAELSEAGVDVPAVVGASAALVHSGGAKWHVPVTGKAYGQCQHAAKLRTTEPQVVVLLDVLPQVCAHCVAAVPVDDGVRALWHACEEIVAAARTVRGLRDAMGGKTVKTWSGYARALAAAAHHHDADVRRLLKPWLVDAVLGSQAWRVLRAWTRVVEKSQAALDDYRAAAPAAGQTAAITGACDAVASAPEVHQQSRALARAVHGSGSPYTWGRADVWSVVREAWGLARAQGQDAAAAHEFARSKVAQLWGEAKVTDVSALPTPAHTTPCGHSSPASWANAEFDHLLREHVAAWCRLLEEALSATVVVEDTEECLLLVAAWPLIAPEDRDLAYLAQWPQVGPSVPSPPGAIRTQLTGKPLPSC